MKKGIVERLGGERIFLKRQPAFYPQTTARGRAGEEEKGADLLPCRCCTSAASGREEKRFGHGAAQREGPGSGTA